MLSSEEFEESDLENKSSKSEIDVSDPVATERKKADKINSLFRITLLQKIEKNLEEDDDFTIYNQKREEKKKQKFYLTKPFKLFVQEIRKDNKLFLFHQTIRTGLTNYFTAVSTIASSVEIASTETTYGAKATSIGLQATAKGVDLLPSRALPFLGASFGYLQSIVATGLALSAELNDYLDKEKRKKNCQEISNLLKLDTEKIAKEIAIKLTVCFEIQLKNLKDESIKNAAHYAVFLMGMFLLGCDKSYIQKQTVVNKLLEDALFKPVVSLEFICKQIKHKIYPLETLDGKQWSLGVFFAAPWIMAPDGLYTNGKISNSYGFRYGTKAQAELLEFEKVTSEKAVNLMSNLQKGGTDLNNQADPGLKNTKSNTKFTHSNKDKDNLTSFDKVEVPSIVLNEEKNISKIKINKTKDIKSTFKEVEQFASSYASKANTIRLELDCSEMKLGKTLIPLLEKLKNFDFVDLNLRGNEITDNIFLGLPKLKSSSNAVLDLSNNRLTCLSMKRLSSWFNKEHTVNILNLTENKLNKSGCFELIQNLARLKIKLKVLSLSSNFNSGAEEKPKPIAALENGALLSCYKLDLSRNFIKATDGLFVAELIRYLDGIKELDLSYNTLGGNGTIEKLMDVLKESESTAIKLVLLNNRIGSCDIEAIYDCRNDLIRTLDLSDNQFTPDMADNLSKLLKENDQLESLALIKCGFNDRCICDFFADGLAENKGLIELNLDFNGITDKGVLGLKKGLLNHKKLSKLSLGNNKIGNQGAQYLVDIYTGLTHLALESNEIARNGIAPLADTLPKNQLLRELNLAGNPLGDDGVIRLAEGLGQNNSVVGLNLASTKMTDRSAKVLARKIKEKPIVVELEKYTTGYSALPFYATVFFLATMTAAWSKEVFFEPGIRSKFMSIGGFLGSGFLYASGGVIYAATLFAEKFSKNDISPSYKSNIHSHNMEVERSTPQQIVPEDGIEDKSLQAPPKAANVTNKSQLPLGPQPKKSMSSSSFDTEIMVLTEYQRDFPLHFILEKRILFLQEKLVNIKKQIRIQVNQTKILELQKQEKKLNEDILIRLRELDFYLGIKDQNYFKKNELGQTILHFLAVFNPKDTDVQKFTRCILNRILTHHANALESFTEGDMFGQTPLHVAAKEGNYFFITVFLKYDNIDLLKENNDGETCLHIAAQWSEVNLFKQLLERLFRKKHRNLAITGPLLSKKNSERVPLLHYTVYRVYNPTLLQQYHNNLDPLLANLQLLLKDYNKIFKINGVNAKDQTVLHLALMQDEVVPELVDVLLLYDSKIDSNVDKTDNSKRTPLELIICKKHPSELYDMLLQRCLRFVTVQNAVKCMREEKVEKLFDRIIHTYCVYMATQLREKVKSTIYTSFFYASLDFKAILCEGIVFTEISFKIEQNDGKSIKPLIKGLIDALFKRLTNKKLTQGFQIASEFKEVIGNFHLSSSSGQQGLFKADKKTLFCQAFIQKVQEYQRYAKEQSIEALPTSNQRGFTDKLKDVAMSRGKQFLEDNLGQDNNNKLKLEVDIIKFKNAFQDLTKEELIQAAEMVFDKFNIIQINEKSISELVEACMQRIVDYINNASSGSLNVKFIKLCIDGILKGSSGADGRNLLLEDGEERISISDFINPSSVTSSSWLPFQWGYPKK